jgi:hypothetical protein
LLFISILAATTSNELHVAFTNPPCYPLQQKVKHIGKHQALLEAFYNGHMAIKFTEAFTITKG